MAAARGRPTIASEASVAPVAGGRSGANPRLPWPTMSAGGVVGAPCGCNATAAASRHAREVNRLVERRRGRYAGIVGSGEASYHDFGIEVDAGRGDVIVGRLQAYVTGSIACDVASSLEKVVRYLNERGHELELAEESYGGVEYFDRSRSDGERRLRLSVDFVVSAGFEVTEPREPE